MIKKNEEKEGRMGQVVSLVFVRVVEVGEEVKGEGRKWNKGDGENNNNSDDDNDNWNDNKDQNNDNKEEGREKKEQRETLK